jgi:hypothetical protein
VFDCPAELTSFYRLATVGGFLLGVSFLVIEIQAHTSVSRRRLSDTRLVYVGSLNSVAPVGTDATDLVRGRPRTKRGGRPGVSGDLVDGLGERPSPNQTGWRTGGGSHGDDTESDGASLARPQPYEGDKRALSRCVAGSLRVRVGTEGRRPPESTELGRPRDRAARYSHRRRSRRRRPASRSSPRRRSA